MKKYMLSLLLLTGLLLSLFSCAGGTQSGETTSPPEPAPETVRLKLTENGEALYRIVRTERDDVENRALFTQYASALNKRIHEKFKVLIPVVTDYESESQSDRTEKEIIIGEVAGYGTEYTYDRDALGQYGYSITQQGEKLVIAAGSPIGYEIALRVFLTRVVGEQEGELVAVLPEPMNVPSDKASAMSVADGPNHFEIADKTDLIGICYSMWFDLHMGTTEDGKIPPEMIYNVEEILAGKGDWGPEGAFHYWSEPQRGYYASTDPAAAADNMRMLGEAGVDFVILDFTFLQIGRGPGTDFWNRCVANTLPVLLNAVKDRLDAGLPTPRVVIWSFDRAYWEGFYEEFYNKEEWSDCFVYWNGKPFIMEWIYGGDNHPLFTNRGQGGLLWNKPQAGQWSYLEVDNSIAVSDGYNGKGEKIAEHMPVCVATQETYMTAPTAHGRNHGIFWYRQWQRAFECRPKILTLTWWNEWGAGRYLLDGEYRFVDNYNMEYSRDIEPMKGGHGDRYYKWMIEYIRAYRKGEQCPVLVEKGYEEEARE